MVDVSRVRLGLGYVPVSWWEINIIVRKI